VTSAQVIVAGYRDGASLRQLARRFNLGVTTVHSILRRHGEPRRGVGQSHRPPTAAQLERDRAVIAAYRAGNGMHTVARQLGLSTSQVWTVLERHNEPRHERHQPERT
jgi:Mor family transcriptional regulator